MQEFNKGVYDYIIATDESGAHGEQDAEDETVIDDVQNEVKEPEEECNFFSGVPVDCTLTTSKQSRRPSVKTHCRMK